MTSIIGSTGVHIVDINSNAENQHLKSPSWVIWMSHVRRMKNWNSAFNKGYLWNIKHQTLFI